MTVEDRGPSEAIASYLRARLRQGRVYNPTRLIAAETGLSTHVVGVRMGMMTKETWHGMVISVWSDTVWHVREMQRHGCKAI
jgi:hypothetical protein